MKEIEACSTIAAVEKMLIKIDEMKSRDDAYMVGIADSLLFTIKSLDVEINKRAYNLLRYLVTERNDVNSDDSDE